MMPRKTQLKFSFFIFLLVTGYWLLVTSHLTADTIYTNDKEEVRGVVVEDYKDRVIFSTADGEKTVMKSDMSALYYDSEEDNLMKLSQLAQEREDFSSAYAYCDKALKLNPDSKRAKEGRIFLQGYLFRKEAALKEEAVRRQEEIEHSGGHVTIEESGPEETARAIEKFKKTTGIAIGLNGNFPQVVDIKDGSSAYEAGMRRGDILVAIWGRLTGYMSLKEVIDNLGEKSSSETRCVIERVYDVTINDNRNPLSSSNDLIGASFNTEFDGHVVSALSREIGPAHEAGLEKGDLLTAIDGESTRYMPLRKVVETIRRSKQKSVKLTIRRELTFWRS